MQLTGHKQGVNITLQIKETSFILIIDNAAKVVRIEYTNETKLNELRTTIDKMVSELGYDPKKVLHTKVKGFNFNKR